MKETQAEVYVSKDVGVRWQHEAVATCGRSGVRAKQAIRGEGGVEAMSSTRGVY